MINNVLPYLLVPAAFIMGSVPFGIMASRAAGVDLQKSGSGNIGATNVLRTVGKWPAVLTLTGDFLKGAAAVFLCRIASGGELLEGIIVISVVLGHMYSLFLSFKGGKGVATGLGALAVYSWESAVILTVVWLFTLFLTRFSSLSAIVAFLSLPVIFILSDEAFIKICFAIVLSFLIILKHRENIKRLLNGTEARVGHREDMVDNG